MKAFIKRNSINLSLNEHKITIVECKCVIDALLRHSNTYIIKKSYNKPMT